MKRALLSSLILTSLLGCGGSSSGNSGDDNGGQPLESGLVIIQSLDLSKYDTIGNVSSDNTYMPTMSVGIFGDSVEAIEPEFGVTSDVDPDFGVIAPPACLAFPTVQITSVDELTDEWKLVNAEVPERFYGCDFSSTMSKTYFVHNDSSVYHMPEGFSVRYATTMNETHVMIQAPHTSRNETDNPVIIMHNSNGEQGIYTLKTDTIEAGAQLELLVPNTSVGDWDYNKFVYLDDAHVYYVEKYGDELLKIEWRTGKVVDSWDWESIKIPFKYQDTFYSVKHGDAYVELLPNGVMGEELQLPPNSHSNSYNVETVIDDRWIISDRCAIWDMQAFVGDVPFAGTGNHDIEFEDGNVFCSGLFNEWDGANEFYGGFSFNLANGTINHKVNDLSTNSKIQQSLKLVAPELMYIDNEENVFEDDHITIDLITGEKTVVKHYYQGEKVIDLRPLN